MKQKNKASVFQQCILAWFDQHGRKHLPWQQNKTPYRVWVSEIMLQQTQVSTVIPYYDRFMQRFPELKDLADAPEDDVLHLWAGLGYYSRARNLHKAAKMVQTQFAGKFPDNVVDLQQLPGIGQSTAGAILSIAFNQPAPILDGNVKRVLARFHAITAPVNEKTTENELWDYATAYTPVERVADYTQAMMDLGATLCTRSKPACSRCPLQSHCVGYAQGIAELLPKKKATKEIPTRQATFLIIKQDQQVLLYKRPAIGIWGGLYSFPEMAGEPNKKTIREFCREQLQMEVNVYQTQPSFRHTFSHYHLDIFPVIIDQSTTKATKIRKIMEDNQQIWYNPANPESIGLPKPVQMILKGLS